MSEDNKITVEGVVEFCVRKLFYLMLRSKGVHDNPLEALKRSFGRRYGDVNPQIVHWLCSPAYCAFLEGADRQAESRILEYYHENGKRQGYRLIKDRDEVDISSLVGAIADGNRHLMQPLVSDLNSGAAYLTKNKSESV